MMKKMFRATMLAQIQAYLDNPKILELLQKSPPKKGWIHHLRKALGMTTYQLATRVGCAQSNIIAAEQREHNGRITIETLDSIAKAMHCRCVYLFVPKEPLRELLEDQAKQIAKKRIAATSHSMHLEEQGLSAKQLKHQEEELVRELLSGNSKHLWEE
jgi:predicted DNA-binding mobile mystery protein A